MGKTGKKQTEKKRLKCEYVQASGTYNCEKAMIFFFFFLILKLKQNAFKHNICLCFKMHMEFWVWGRETSLDFTINLLIWILEVRHLLFTHSSNQRR